MRGQHQSNYQNIYSKSPMSHQSKPKLQNSNKSPTATINLNNSNLGSSSLRQSTNFSKKSEAFPYQPNTSTIKNSANNNHRNNQQTMQQQMNVNKSKSPIRGSTDNNLNVRNQRHQIQDSSNYDSFNVNSTNQTLGPQPTVVHHHHIDILSLNKQNINEYFNQQEVKQQQQLQKQSQNFTTNNNKSPMSLIKKKEQNSSNNFTNIQQNQRAQLQNQQQFIYDNQIHLSSQQSEQFSQNSQVKNIIFSPSSQMSLKSSDTASKKENVQVFIRIRPPFQHEIEENSPSQQYLNQLQSYHQNPHVQDLQADSWSCIQATPPCWVTLRNQQDVPKDFQFSQIFADQASQSDVFAETALPLVFHVLNGYHGCYFVYGQTGTGKTHTMGVLNQITPESQGIIPSSLDFIFRFFEEQQKSNQVQEWQVIISFYQIYQEQIQDLFNPVNKNLSVREENGEVFVEDLVEVPVHNLEQAMNIINAGLEHRQMASQNMNQTSSRSHTILNIDVFQTKQIGFSNTQQVTGRLTLVDLAGSERVRHTTSSGARLDEAKHINASLSALGNVISSLANQKQQFIPYRSSKLTRVLQNSLSGSSKIVVLATLGPSAKNYQESLSTLQFAQRCKEIILTPLVHTSTNQDQDNEQLQQIIIELKEKILEMQGDVEGFEQREGGLQNKLREKSVIISQYEEKIRLLEEENYRLSDIESEKRETTYAFDNEKVQQLQDLSKFMIKLIQKLTNQTCDTVNQIYQMKVQYQQNSQQNLIDTHQIQELDSQFPVLISKTSLIESSQALDIPLNYNLLDENVYSLPEIATKLSYLAKLTLDNHNLIAQASNIAIPLKQHHLETLLETQQKLKILSQKYRLQQKNHFDNVQSLMKELIEIKKAHIKDAFKLHFIQKKMTISAKDKVMLKEKIVQELRNYIAEEIIPELKGLDLLGNGGVNQISEGLDEEGLEQQQSFVIGQEGDEIDNEIMNLSFTLNTLETEVNQLNQLNSFDNMNPILMQQDSFNPQFKDNAQLQNKKLSSSKVSERDQHLTQSQQRKMSSHSQNYQNSNPQQALNMFVRQASDFSAHSHNPNFNHSKTPSDIKLQIFGQPDINALDKQKRVSYQQEENFSKKEHHLFNKSPMASSISSKQNTTQSNINQQLNLFRKQKVFSSQDEDDSNDDSDESIKQRSPKQSKSRSQSEDVILEEEKESDYTLQTEERKRLQNQTKISPQKRQSSNLLVKESLQHQQRQQHQLQLQSITSSNHGSSYQQNPNILESQNQETGRSRNEGRQNQQNTIQSTNSRELKRLSKSTDRNPLIQTQTQSSQNSNQRSQIQEQSRSRVNRADKVIILSKDLTERTMLKFLNFFAADKKDQKLSISDRSPINTTKKQRDNSQNKRDLSSNSNQRGGSTQRNQLQNTQHLRDQEVKDLNYVQQKGKQNFSSSSQNNKVMNDNSPINRSQNMQKDTDFQSKQQQQQQNYGRQLQSNRDRQSIEFQRVKDSEIQVQNQRQIPQMHHQRRNNNFSESDEEDDDDLIQKETKIRQQNVQGKSRDTSNNRITQERSAPLTHHSQQHVIQRQFTQQEATTTNISSSNLDKRFTFNQQQMITKLPPDIQAYHQNKQNIKRMGENTVESIQELKSQRSEYSNNDSGSNLSGSNISQSQQSRNDRQKQSQQVQQNSKGSRTFYLRGSSRGSADSGSYRDDDQSEQSQGFRNKNKMDFT
eukprot:403351186